MTTLTRLLLGVLLALLVPGVQAVDRVIYYRNDALGSPVVATNQRGEVLWRRSYTPYGEELNREAPNEPGYTGKIEEPDLGISDFGARWYDPRIGRFLAIDPVGFSPDNPQSFNRYAYANNNPYKYVDPNGESPLDIGFFIFDTVQFSLAVYSGNPQAIASATADLAASAVGLISPVPGTGLAIKAARAADKIHDVANAAEGVGIVAKRAARGGESAGAAAGRQAHKELADRVAQKPGWQSEPRLVGADGKVYKPDVVTPDNHILELKPNTPSGRAAGERQIHNYEEQLGMRSRVIYYDPKP